MQCLACLHRVAEAGGLSPKRRAAARATRTTRNRQPVYVDGNEGDSDAEGPTAPRQTVQIGEAIEVSDGDGGEEGHVAVGDSVHEMDGDGDAGFAAEGHGGDADGGRQPTTIISVAALRKFFPGIDDASRKMNSAAKRVAGEFNAAVKKVVRGVAEAVAELLAPGRGQELVEETFSEDAALRDELIRLMKSENISPLSRRYLRAFVYGLPVSVRGSYENYVHLGDNLLRSRAKEDWQLLNSGKDLQRIKRHYCRIGAEKVHSLVDFIHEAVDVLSFGLCKRVIDGVETTLPALFRKQTIQSLWQLYQKRVSNGVSRGPFFLVARLVTSSLKQMRSSIDYIVCDLVHENKKRLQNVVKRVRKGHQSMLPKYSIAFTLSAPNHLHPIPDNID